MHLIEFYEHPENSLPKSRPTGDFEQYLASIFDNFQEKLNAVDEHDEFAKEVRSKIPVVATVVDEIKKAVRVYHEGFPHLAYRHLDKALTTLGPDLDRLLPAADMASQLGFLYRARVSAEPKLDRTGIFHLPFEARHKVGTQRYSIPGLPCLYLGGSVHVTWKELNMPNKTTMHISRFKAVPGYEGGLKIVNFGHRPGQLGGLVATGYANKAITRKYMTFVSANIACWPVIAACSIRKLDPKASFHSEYIMPQLVLQWIQSSQRFDGIRYFSTHIDEIFQDPVGQMNYAIPAKDHKPFGHCQTLKGQFEFTEPMSWSEVVALPPVAVKIPHMNFKVDYGAGEVDYASTDMGEVQEKVARLDTARLP